MEIHDLIQGESAWDQFRLDHFGASEAAAMLGLSRNVTRNELLRMKKTGIAKVFSDWVQEHVLDHGHSIEEKVREITEGIIGEDLYPVTCSLGKISASCDGLTSGDRIAFECKQWNAGYGALVLAGTVPEEHAPQCQQVLMVTGAEKLIFVMSDGTPEKLATFGCCLTRNGSSGSARAGRSSKPILPTTYRPSRSRKSSAGRPRPCPRCASRSPAW
ncbi:MAG: YqaJ viral recombinase family protein [Variovorax sp.]